MAGWSEDVRKSCGWLLQSRAAGLQKDGVKLMLDCKWEEARIVFEEGRELDPAIAGAHCMVMLMRYLSSFEEEHRVPILAAIKWAEEACGSSHGKFKKELKHLEAFKPEEELMLKAAKLHLEISLGDCELCHAMSAMLSMDLTGFLKGGWHLRKAWKLYESCYREAKQLYDEDSNTFTKPVFQCERDCTGSEHDKNCLSMPGSTNRKRSDTFVGDGTINSNGAVAVGNDETRRPRSATSNKENSGGIKPNDIMRSEMVHQLFSSAAFGYGLFHLCASVLAPSVLKVVQFLGFPSNRSTGIGCLKFVSKSRHPLKSSMAALSLLWYHTIARPFFALDLNSISAGVADADKILLRQPNSKDTVLFLFFRGRCERLKKDLPSSLRTFNRALDAAGTQRELRLMCLYEIGWCHLLQMEWSQARACFAEMKSDSKWAPSYYAYLEGLCVAARKGAAYGEAQAIFGTAMHLVKKKKNPIEAFVLKRATTFSKEEHITEEIGLLYVLEMVYLWRALQNTPEYLVQAILKTLESLEISDSTAINWALFYLTEGSLLTELSRMNSAEIKFKKAISTWETMTGTKSKETRHIPAFASYELGCLLIRNEATKEDGRAQLEKAKDHYKGYDFEKRLHVRIHAALNSLD